MDMEIELITNDMSEEDNFQVYNDNYNEQDISTFEEESCGICMDIVIDRGVLDCCQHWFCFACIDNWATITNLCPLCQNEFQLITCVPVYDTTGSNKVEDDSFSRDDDWCIEGKNSSLSFPSYYIDENAVVCLDGDDCKIRSGSKVDNDLNFDMSIACDSCDIWYHAFCVGFDPENTTESTWLCPRCVVCEMPKISATNSVEAAFSRKVSVSVADVGETAVVVSMVGGNQWCEDPNLNFLSTPEVDMDQQNDSFTPRSDTNGSKVETLSNKLKKTEPKMDVEKLELSLSDDKSPSLSSTFVPSVYNENCADKGVNKQPGLGESCIPEMSESDASISLRLGLYEGSFLSGDHVKNDGTENQAAVGVQRQKLSNDYFLLADTIVHDAVVGDVGITSVKRKHTSCSEDVLTRTEDGEIKANIGTEISAKKVKTMRKIQMIPSLDQVSKSDSDDSQECCYPMALNKDDKGTHNLEKKDATSDIMSIVQGTDRRPLKGLARPITTDKFSKEREAGLRVKKIMRRAARDKESSIIVQNLRKEIREAIRNKSSIDFGKKLFDPKLLAAFRTAVAGPETEPAKKTSHFVVKAKKSILQKGKSRENLTKKIYGINGRRKRAWDRECEIEFWKHRCMRTTKPEKIETLKSVLDLLRRNTENGEIEQQSELHTANPILSRLYLADTSVFPRKDDNIKPLAALKVAGKAELNEEQHTSVEKTFLINHIVKTTVPNNVSTSTVLPLFDKKKKDSVSCLKGNAASSKVNLNRSSGGPSLSGSKVNAQKEVVKSDNIKSDKRKWALEVLARKTAVAGGNTNQDKHKDNAMLKGNYPLLAQLPVDMRPVLAPTRHNKVPVSIRQAQLYRLTEHFLRKENQPVIHRTAETELAVADAVNIEKEVADRSNSKVVYVNLCSQELLRRSSNSNTEGDVESDPSPLSAVSTDKSVQGTCNISIDPDAEEALRTAGLLSDSPPNSPREELKDGDEDDLTKKIEEGPNNISETAEKINGGGVDDPSKKIEEGPDNIFEIDSHPELDIYGDFEYDLEDEDYIGASTIIVSKLQSEEESSRMKVVFSTLSSDRPNNALICETSEGLGISEVLKDSVSLLKYQTTDTELKYSDMEGRADESCRPLESLPGEGGEELSLADCEELYGPDKEPLIERFAGASGKEYGPVGAESLTEDITLERDENYASNQKVRASELGSQSYVENDIVATNDHNSTDGKTSPNNTQTSGNVQRENKPNNDSNKPSDSGSSVSKKVEAYIKEHIRPLCKSGVISVERYRWAVTKTTEKVMKFHSKDKNASFLIKEGEKVKKLAEQYVEAAKQKEK